MELFPLSILKELEPTAVQNDLPAKSFIRLKDEVITTAFVVTGKEILPSIAVGCKNIDNNNLEPEDVDFGVRGLKCPSWEELGNALDII